MERSAAETVEQADAETVAYWRDRALRAERDRAAERERFEFLVAAVVGCSDGRVRYA